MAKNAKEILEAIKQFFADALPTSYKLADGTDVTISLLDIGGDFGIGGQPAAEGTYTLMDGTNVTVDSTGKITEVVDPGEFEVTEYTLEDGTKITIDKMEVGGQVVQGDTPIANGEYTLEDGSKFTTVDGLITVITPKDEQVMEEETPAPSPLTEQVKELVTKAIQDELATYKQGMESQETAQKLAFKKQEDTITKQGEVIKQMLELMTQLAESPDGDPPLERKTIFSGSNTKKSARERYAEAADKLHNETIKN